MEKDAVCGMMVDPGTAPASSHYKEVAFYLCAKGCRIAFGKDPERYIGK